MQYKILEKMFKGENPTSVFEVGCANGGFLKDLGVKVVGGIDKHSGDIEKSKSDFPEGEFLLQDINQLPWNVKPYDIVFSIGTLMYIENPEPVIKEMLRIGKKVIIAEPLEGESVIDHHGARFYHDYSKFNMELIGVENHKTIWKK